MFFSVLLRLWKAVILGHASCHWTKGTCSVLRGFHEVKEPLNCRLQNPSWNLMLLLLYIVSLALAFDSASLESAMFA